MSKMIRSVWSVKPRCCFYSWTDSGCLTFNGKTWWRSEADLWSLVFSLMSINRSEVIRQTDCCSHDSFLQTCWEDPTLKFFFLYYRVFDDMKLWKVKSFQCVSYRQNGKQEVAVLWVFSSGSDARRHLRRYDRRVHLAGCTVRYQGNARRWETAR